MTVNFLLLALAAVQLSKVPSQVRHQDDAGNIEVVLKVAGEGLSSRGADGGGIIDFWLGIRNVASSSAILSEVTDVGVWLLNGNGPLAASLTTGRAHCLSGAGNHLILPGETFFVLVRLRIKKKDLAATAAEAYVSILEARNPNECGTLSRYGKVRLALKFKGTEVVLSPEPAH